MMSKSERLTINRYRYYNPQNIYSRVKNVSETAVKVPPAPSRYIDLRYLSARTLDGDGVDLDLQAGGCQLRNFDQCRAGEVTSEEFTARLPDFLADSDVCDVYLDSDNVIHLRICFIEVMLYSDKNFLRLFVDADRIHVLRHAAGGQTRNMDVIADHETIRPGAFWWLVDV